MKRRCFAIITLLAMLLPLLPGSIVQAGSGKTEEGLSAYSGKISGLLSMQVAAKVHALEAGGIRESTPEGTVNILEGMQAQGMELGDLTMQQIFIHAEEKPDPDQLTELEDLELIVYQDSWIPPLENHPTGFLLADMPVKRLEELASIDFVISLNTAERTFEAQNDLATQAMNADDVWTAGYDGSGVTIAVLDSGLDVTHPDIPTPVASKDYHDYPVLDDTIANYYGGTGHGTHVAGSALGRGTQSSGVYKGSAPGADLVFLKIGGDTTTSAPTAAIVGAVRDAVDVYNADIITMSYGGWDSYHDGSCEESQAYDYAVSQGAVAFCSAGNSGNDDEHYSGTVPASSETGFIQLDVTEVSGETALAYNLVWYDGLGTHNDLELKYYDSSYTPIPQTNGSQSESSRGTESEYSYHNSYLPGNGTYYVKVANNSASGQDFHLYYDSSYNNSGAGWVAFNSPDPFYTIGSPAHADCCIAIGAYTTRGSWYDYTNTYQSYGLPADQIASFSSRGPRVDGGGGSKPSIVAPGCHILSCRDIDAYPWADRNSLYIDNDAPNQNNASYNDGNGPADYYQMQGTSMACPHAAGVAALILEANPGFSPAQVRSVLELTAMDKGPTGQDDTYGYGLIDAMSATSPPMPDIAVGPASFCVTLPPDTTWDGTLTIDNDGAAALNYAIYDYETTGFSSMNFEDSIALIAIDAKYQSEPVMKQNPDEKIALPTEEQTKQASQWIYYDDGGWNYAYYWGLNCQWAVKFTPASYPCRLLTARFYIVDGWPDTNHEQFGINIYDDDGAGNSPGTLLGGINHTATNWEWVDVDISGENIIISEGDFYIAYQQLSAGSDSEALGLDIDTDNSRSWGNGGAGWSISDLSPNPQGAWMIRCQVSDADCSWLGESPVSGTVAAAGSDDITVSFDTTGLSEGDYSADIVINSNDYDENSVTIPVALHVAVTCNVLFEQAHSPVEWTMEGFYSDWASLLESQGMNVASLNTGPVTGAALSSYDVIIISNPTASYSTDEINAIKQFVNDGGGLFILGEWGLYSASNNITSNQIATEFGITFNNDSVRDSLHHDGPNQVWPLIGEFDNAIIGTDVSEAVILAGCSLGTTGSAFPIAWAYDNASASSPAPGAGSPITGEETLLSSGETAAFTTDNEPEAFGDGPIVMAAATYGSGRVVAVGDGNLFGNSDSSDPDDGTIDLNEYDNEKVAVDIPEWLCGLTTGQIDISLSEGWNLISLPLIPDSTGIDAVISNGNLASGNIANIVMVYNYNTTAEKWLWWNETPASTLSTIEDGLGYWVYATAADTLTVHGTQAAHPGPGYAVSIGWNMIGFTSTTDMAVETYLASEDGNYSLLYCWMDGGWLIWTTAASTFTNMDTGYGYWLSMNTTGTVTPP